MRGSIDEYTQLGVVPLGINGESIESHLRFKAELGLTFDLLTDEDLIVCGQYGALRPADEPGKYPVKRTVVIVDLDGTIVYRHSGNPHPASQELLRVVSALG